MLGDKSRGGAVVDDHDADSPSTGANRESGWGDKEGFEQAQTSQIATKAGKKPTEQAQAVSFSGNERSAAPAVHDPEFGQFQHETDIGYASNEAGKAGIVVQKSMFTRRKMRAYLVTVVLLVFLFILFQLSFSPKETPASASPKCDAGMSASYSSNRNVSWRMCIKHQELSAWNNSELTDFLLPADKASKNPPIRFLVVGDFGRDGYCCQRDVALEMERAAVSISADFVINTGDSFYNGGILKSSDEQVRTSFLNVYNYTYLRSKRFFSVLGNNEYRGSVSAVMDIPSKHNYRFDIGKGNNRYYSQVIKGSSDMHLQVLFLDTTPMIDSYKIPGYDGPDMLKRPDGVTTQFDKIEQQTAWLEDRLQNEKYPYIMRLVVGHHPIYDRSAHPGDNRTFLQTRIAPLLEKYNVTAMFAGHDHNMQMAKPAKTAYFVSGAGSKLAPAAQNTPDTPESAVRFYYMENGFLACTVFLDEMRVAVVNMEGKVLDKVIVKKRYDED